MVGVEPEPSRWVKPPRIKRSPVALERKLWRAVGSPVGMNHLVIGEVAGFYVRDDIHVNGRIDFSGIHPVGRLAAEYTHVDNAFVPPLDPEKMSALLTRRMVPLDGKGTTYSALDTSSWSS